MWKKFSFSCGLALNMADGGSCDDDKGSDDDRGSDDDCDVEVQYRRFFRLWPILKSFCPSADVVNG